MKKRLISVLLTFAMLMSYAVIVNATETNNVSLGKAFVTENGRAINGWTNGELEEGDLSLSAETRFVSGAENDGLYAVLDLGAQYDLASLRVESTTTSWNYWGAKFYGSNIATGLDGAVLLLDIPAEDVQAGTLVFDKAVTGSYRYIYMQKTSSDQQMQEVSVFANQEESSVSFVDSTVPEVVSNVEAGETVELEFTDAVNLVSLALGSYAETEDGTQTPVSFYAVDDTTVALDPATLSANTAYTLVIDENVDDANGNKIAAISVEDIEFTTGMVAKVAHKDGKYISSVSTNKDIWADSQTEAANTGLKTWVDGNANSDFVFGSTDYPSDFVVVDLGAEYAIESIGAMTQAPWNSKVIGFYLTDSVDGLTYGDLQALDASEYSKLVLCQDNATGNTIDYAAADNTKSTRYVVMWDTTGNSTPCIKELYAYAYTEPYAVGNVALGKAFVAEKGREIKGWTNGELEEGDLSLSSETRFVSGADNDGTYAVLDLGAEYDLTSLKVESTVASWNYWGAKFYGSNIATGLDGAVLLLDIPATDVQAGKLVFDKAVTGSYRYIYMQKTSSDQQMQEVSVFAKQGVSDIEYVDSTVPAAVSNIDAGKTVTLEFTGAVNLASLAAGSYAEASTGVQTPVSFYAVDDTTVALDPATLASNTSYTLVVENAEDADGNIIDASTIEEISFTTGVVAKVAHKDGKFISSVSTNKSIWADSGVASANTGLKTWVDDDANTNFVFRSVADPNNPATEYYPNDFVVVDLGTEYTIESIGAMTQAPWNSKVIGFYLTNSVEGLTFADLQALGTSEYSKLVLCQDNATGNTIDYAEAKAADAVRYIVMWDTTGNSTPCIKDLYAYAYTEPFNVNNVALGKAFVTEKGREIKGWTNGELEEGDLSLSGDTAFVSGADNDGTYAVLDLGTKYDLVSIKIESTTQSWNYWGANFYGSNDLSTGIAGATLLYSIPQADVSAGTLVFDQPVKGAYRYIYMEKTSSQQQMQEVSVFAKQGDSNVEFVDSTVPAVVSNIDAGKTVTLEFTGAVNINSLAAGSYAETEDGTQTPVSFYAVDDTTVALDPATLTSNTAYTLVIDETVEDVNGNAMDAVTVEDIEFTTGTVAKVAHKDGKFIGSVSTNKNIWADSGAASANTGLKTWVDGDANSDFVFRSVADPTDESKEYYPNDFVVVDLGAEYAIESIGAMTQAPWNSKVIGFYLTNSVEGLTIADLQGLDASEYSKLVLCQDNATGNTIDYAEAKAADAVRYIVMWDTTGNSTPCIKELYAYAYTKPFEINNVALGKSFVTENGRTIKGWTNGELEEGDLSLSGDTAFKAKDADGENDGTYAVLDLGAEYDITSLKVESTVASWNYWGANFYGSNDLSTGIAGATLLYSIPQADVSAGTLVFNQAVTGSYRYIYMEKTSSQQQMQEVSVFAAQKDSDISVVDVTAPEVVSNIGVGETVTFEFTGAINVASLASGIYAETEDGTKTPVSFYAVDETTYAIEPSTLKSNTAYTLVVADTVDDTEGNIVNMASVEDIEFTTGTVAKVAHKDGKFIGSVSTNKNIWANSGAASANTGLKTWVDDDVETNFVFRSVADPTDESKEYYPNDFVVVDLGAEYTIESIGAMTQAAWNSKVIGFYLTNSVEGLTFADLQDLDASEYSKLVLCQDNATGNTIDYAEAKAADAVRYIVMWDTTGNSTPCIKELYAYAYVEPFEVNNVALNKSFVTENGRTIKGWTNGVLEAGDLSLSADTAFVSGAESDGTYAVLDLGAKHDLVSIKIESTTTSWNYWGANFYGSNDLSTGIAGATLLYSIPMADVQAGTLTFNVPVTGAYRYIYMEKDNSQQQMQEVSVFATQKISTQEATFDFKGMENAVTNIDTTERIEVSFPEGTDMSTVNDITVYAVAQEAKGSVVAAGASYSVGVENIGDNTVAIDVAGLESSLNYKLVVSALNAAGEFIVSEAAFTTGAIANIAYSDNAFIADVARGKAIKSASGTVDNELKVWVDANPSTAFAFRSDWYPNDYAYIDLGAEYKISQIAIQTDNVAWASQGAGVILAKTMDGVTYESLTDAYRFPRATAQTVYDGMLDYTNIDDTESYRYVIVKNMIPERNINLTLKGIYVFVEQATSDVTAEADWKGMQDAVTNVGTTDRVEVTFLAPVQPATLAGHVYAVAKNTLENNAQAAYVAGDMHPVDVEVISDTKIAIDVAKLEGFCEYELIVDGALDADGKYVRASAGDFTTGLIAYLPYAEGKVIKNVALGKTVYAINPKDPVINGGDGKLDEGEEDLLEARAAKWIDGDKSTSFVADLRADYLELDYVVIDLGKEYDIEAIGAYWSSPWWASTDTAVYLTNDITNIAPENGTDFAKAKVRHGFQGVLDYAEVEGGSYRYVILYNPLYGNGTVSTSIAAGEVYVFAYETENDFYFAKEVTTIKVEEDVNGEMKEVAKVDDILIRAEIENAGTGTLVIAEYNGDGKLLNVKSAPLDGAGNAEVELDFVATSTYKAFIWNALGGENSLTPVLPSITNDIQ